MNIVIGLCDFFDNVPCRRSNINVPPVDPECPPGEIGDRNSEINCASFIQCNDGTKDGTFECGEDLHFNPDTNTCDKPANLDPLCTDSGLPQLPPAVLLAPIIGPEKIVESHKSFRERLLTKLHLNH